MKDVVPLLCLCYAICLHRQLTVATKFNVLFFASDDMRPELGAYEGPDFPSPVHPKIHTPNLDTLARRSLLLKRAYVQQAVCSPSRTSILTGRRPDTTHVHDLVLYFRDVAGNFTTIPQYFKEHGYASVGMGKIFHPWGASGHDDPVSWTAPYFQADRSKWERERSVTWTAADPEKVKKHPLPDQQVAQHAVQTLKKLAPKALSGEQLFFLAVGFYKPHLPWLFPAHFLDYYPLEEINLPNNSYAPVDMPEIAWSDFDELRAYDDIRTKYGYGSINTTLPDPLVRHLRRAYYSAVSYTDSLVGEVIQTLEDLGLANSTIISFWGDHGWQLGEHGEWCKHTNFELATHAPMMIAVPGLTDGGKSTERLTEFVDLYPTLAEAAGLPPVELCPLNSSDIETCTEGVSLVPLMKDPTREWKSAVFSQYPRMNVAGCDVMGYTLRTNRYRYTEWAYYNTVKFEPIWTHLFRNGTELYDHKVDPDENVNKAFHPSYGHEVEKLSRMLHDGWRASLPPSS